MSTESLITDPALTSVLQAAAKARKQSLAVLDLIESFRRETPTHTTADQHIAVSRQHKVLNTYIADLRLRNRNAILGTRTTKQQTAEAKQEIDSLHLQLQNLYYEQRHLKGEIAGCEDYDHKFRRLPLVPHEDFLARHPEFEAASEHDLTIARIKDEQTARQALEDQRQQLLQQKDAMVKETTAKKEELGKLDAEIEKWVAGQASVRKLLDAHDKAMNVDSRVGSVS